MRRCGTADVVVVSAFPPWLINGILLGLAAAGTVLLIYVVGLRYLDDVPIPTPSDPNKVRRAEIRAYLAAIGEPAIERAIVAGEEVAFWLPDRDLAITFAAETYFTLEERNIATVLVEHEVPGYQIGARLPFDTPPLHRRTDGVDDDARWASSTLGVEPDADVAEIDAAYRERVLEAHPDRGGSRDELSDVLRAYEVLTEATPA